MSQGDTPALRSAPSGIFSNSADTTKTTKGIYFAPSSGQSFTVHCAPSDVDVTFYVDGQVIPVETDETVTISGYGVVYLY